MRSAAGGESSVVSGEMRALARSADHSQRSVVVSAFSGEGDGGLAVLDEGGFSIVDRHAGRGLTEIDGVMVRIVREEPTDGEFDSTWCLSVVTDDGQAGEVLTGSSDLEDICCVDDGLLISTGTQGEVLRLSASELRSSIATGSASELLPEVVARVDGAIRGLVVDRESVAATVSRWSNGASSGALIDVTTGAVLVADLADPMAAGRWRDRWVITDLSTNALVIVDGANRTSVPLGGLGRGVLVHEDLAFVAVGRPAVLRRPEDRSRYRIVVVDLPRASILGEQIVPLSRLYTIRSVSSAALSMLAKETE